jgi:hypothetical protein
MTERTMAERVLVMEEVLHRLETKSDTIIKQQSETNGRVKSLEIWKAGLVGAMSALALGMPVLTAAIVKWIFG